MEVRFWTHKLHFWKCNEAHSVFSQVARDILADKYWLTLRFFLAETLNQNLLKYLDPASHEPLNQGI